MSPVEFKRGLVAAMNAKDLPATLEMIAEDAVYFWSNGDAMFGRAAVAEAMRVNFDSIANDTYETLDVTWIAQSEDVAACVFAFRWSGEIDGRKASGSGRGTSVMRRIDGAWRSVHEHLSAGRWNPGGLTARAPGV